MSNDPHLEAETPAAPAAVGGRSNGPPGFKTVAVTRSYEHVVQQIEAEIRSGRISRGQRLPTERELGAMFGVSRGVIREAVKVLAAMGLVEARQGSGLYVRNDPLPTVTRAFTLSVSPDAHSLERLFEFRRELEACAARLAAERRTEEDLAEMSAAVAAAADAVETNDWDAFRVADEGFHLTIANASDNPYLAVAIGAAREMQRGVVDLFAKSPGSMEIAAAAHRRICDAITAQDADAAATAIAEHIIYTDGVVRQSLTEPPSIQDSATGDGRV